MDYVYKIAVKRALQNMIQRNLIVKNDVERMFFYVDEHTTATNGRYELKEGLEQEFRYGTYNTNYSIYYEPIFPSLKELKLEYCNSSPKSLIRAADIVANNVYHKAVTDQDIWEINRNMHVIIQP